MKKALLVLVLACFSVSSYALEETFFYHGKKEIYKVDGFETTTEQIEQEFKNLGFGVLGSSVNRPVIVSVEEFDSLNFGDNIELAPVVTEEGEFTILLRVTKAGLKNAVGIVEALSVLKAIHTRQVLNAPLELFEILFNAEADHPISKGVLNSINLHALNNPANLSSNFMEASTLEKVKAKFLSTRMTALKKRITKWNKEISKQKSAMRKQEKERKEYLK